jgi:hypothetical protein
MMSSPSRETHFVGATLLRSGAPMPCSMDLLHKMAMNIQAPSATLLEFTSLTNAV